MVKKQNKIIKNKCAMCNKEVKSAKGGNPDKVPIICNNHKSGDMVEFMLK